MNLEDIVPGLIGTYHLVNKFFNFSLSGKVFLFLSQAFVHFGPVLPRPFQVLPILSSFPRPSLNLTQENNNLILKEFSIQKYITSCLYYFKIQMGNQGN